MIYVLFTNTKTGKQRSQSIGERKAQQKVESLLLDSEEAFCIHQDDLELIYSDYFSSDDVLMMQEIEKTFKGYEISEDIKQDIIRDAEVFGSTEKLYEHYLTRVLKAVYAEILEAEMDSKKD